MCFLANLHSNKTPTDDDAVIYEYSSRCQYVVVVSFCLYGFERANPRTFVVKFCSCAPNICEWCMSRFVSSPSRQALITCGNLFDTLAVLSAAQNRSSSDRTLSRSLQDAYIVFASRPLRMSDWGQTRALCLIWEQVANSIYSVET